VLRLFAPGGEAAWLETLGFRVSLRPRYSETDAAGHVSNVVYPAYLEYGRLQYFAAIGDPEAGAFPFEHVTAELHLRYVAACYYDEALDVRSRIVSIGRSSATMEQAIVGAGETVRTVSVVTIVRSVRTGSAPWTAAQRAAIEAFERPLKGGARTPDR
jgi:acyl-CoA thioester hydrolase